MDYQVEKYAYSALEGTGPSKIISLFQNISKSQCLFKHILYKFFHTNSKMVSSLLHAFLTHPISLENS
jgi:hypothetical protein